jgi:hypothetical protein
MRRRLCNFRWGCDMFRPKQHSHRCNRSEGHRGRCECSCGVQL